MANSDFDSQIYYSDDPDDFSQGQRKKKIPATVAFLLLLVGGAFFVQTTLAANNSLNSGAPVEFGQGVSQTAACSGESYLTITPNNAFTNSSGGGDFYFSSITVSEIPDTCYGKDFTIKAYGNSDVDPIALFNTTSTSAVVYDDGGTFKLGIGSSGTSITQSVGTFTVTFTSPVALSSTIFKLTAESGAHTDFVGMGTSGPGGGIVFYYSAAGFSCGPTLASTCNYLEASENTWSGGIIDGTGKWCSNDSVSIAGTLTTIGSGASNTKLIKDGCAGTTIATDVSNLTLGGKSDWYIPSENEAGEFYTQKDVFTGVYELSGSSNADLYRYLTSTQYPVHAASAFVYLKWFNGAAEEGWKNFNFSVRPIRAF